MAVVKVTVGDTRQELLVLMKNEKKQLILNQNFPYEIFVATNFCPIFFTTTAQPAANVNINVFSRPFYVILLLRSYLSDLYFPVDLSIFNTNKNLVYGFSNFLSGTSINLWGSLKAKTLYTISTLYRGFTWVEREHKEFLNVNFIGLEDTRRLLTDYTQCSQDIDADSYKTISYDLLTQTLYF